MHLFKLLQHRIRLPGREGICREEQQGHMVHRGRGGCGNHVGRPRPDGGGTGYDLPPVVLFGKSRGGMGHALFIFPLVDLQSARTAIQGFPQATDNAVAEYSEEPFHKFVFLPVKRHILVIQKTNQCLGSGHIRHVISTFLYFLFSHHVASAAQSNPAASFHSQKNACP